MTPGRDDPDLNSDHAGGAQGSAIQRGQGEPVLDGDRAHERVVHGPPTRDLPIGEAVEDLPGRVDGQETAGPLRTATGCNRFATPGAQRDVADRSDRRPNMTAPTPSSLSLPELDGTAIRPHDAGYDDARTIWNGMIDARPAAILRCATEADVQRAVRCAVDQDLAFAVRGGGHNVAGTATVDGGVVIDLSELRSVTVDPDARRAVAGGGATWADVDVATQAHGLAAPGGVVSDTGIGGLTLAGGIGWLRRKHGLSCDNLVAARLVTADGEVRTVDESSEPELLWGLRGGGGNFGIATELTFQLHPVGPEVFFGMTFYSAADSRQVLERYRDFTTDLSDEVSSFLICGTVPDVEDFPRDIWGERFVLIAAMAATDPATGARLVDPMRRFAEPLLDLSDSMPFTDLQQLFDEDYPAGARYYWKSLHLEVIDDDIVDLCRDWADARPTSLSTLDIWHLGGAMARVPADVTAFGDRSAPYLLGIEANWEDPADDDANLDWVHGCMDAFRGHSTGREYLNFPGFLEDGATTLEAAHGSENYRRLRRLKRRLDPDNVFRRHQNIEPSES